MMLPSPGGMCYFFFWGEGGRGADVLNEGCITLRVCSTLAGVGCRGRCAGCVTTVLLPFESGEHRLLGVFSIALFG